MSYDPRSGTSPYLGMDFDDEPDWDERDQAAQPSPQAVSPQRQGGGVASASSSRDVPPTVLRDSRGPRRGMAPRPVDATAKAQPIRRTNAQGAPAVPSPQQQAYVPEPSPVPSMVRRRFDGPLTTLKASLLVLLAWLLRIGACILALFVVVSAVLTGSMRAQLIGMLNIAPLLVPPALLGLFVRDTPFGGILRGDMIIASIILFVADWFCIRLSTSLRMRRERGV